MAKSISHLSEEATQETNTADVLTPILTLSPEGSTYWQLHNFVSTGEAGGFPIIMDLRDSGNNPISVDTELVLRVERPDASAPEAVSVAESNIAPWVTLTQAEQRNEENIDSVKVSLQGSSINVREDDDLTVEIKSSDVVDWTNSSLYFVREAVDEYGMG